MVFNFVYFSISLLLEFILVCKMQNIRHTTLSIKNELLRPVYLSILTIPVYTAFMLSANQQCAMIFDSLYFICTDWLALFMLFFALKYISPEIKTPFSFRFLIIPCVLDTIQLLSSPFTKHMFNLTPATQYGLNYWSLEMMTPHFIHIGLCYFIVLITLLLLLIATIKTPYTYKTKYSSILFAYFIVILANLLSYSLDLPVDISVFMYSILASYIAYFASFRAEKKLMENSLSRVNEISRDLICYFDTHNNCIYMNKTAKDVFKSIQKRSVEFSLFQKLSLQKFAEKIYQDVIKENYTQFYAEINGNKLYYIPKHAEIYEANDVIGSYLNFYDRTKEISQYKLEEYTATHDTLTNLLNRNQFFELCNQKQQSNEQMLMICTNIRDFKLINDLFGDETGDQVLSYFSTLLQNAIGNDAIIGRIFDDKFAIFIEKEKYQQKLLSRISAELQLILSASKYHINVNFGTCEAHKDNSMKVFDKAKMALENLNENYQETFATYDSVLMEKVLAEKNITSEFDKALENNQFEVMLQPIFNEKKEIRGGEALIRWNHPVKGIYEPAYFIPILEKTGLIHKLDLYSWEILFKFIADNKDLLPDYISYSLNISTKAFFYIDIHKEILKLIDKYKIDPSKILFEFKEEIFTSDETKSRDLINTLKKEGFKCLIDNFGTGYTSFNLLKDINCDLIKLDNELITESENIERTSIILNSTISMCRDIGLKITAVGIETFEQFEMLKDYQCDLFQGFYLSHPLTLENFKNLF